MRTFPAPRHIAIACVAVLLAAANCARADVVAVMSARSPQTALDRAQIADIFLGKRTRFPDGSPAIPIDQREGSAVRDAFYARFTNMSGSQLKAFWSKIIFTGRGLPPKAAADEAELKKLLIEQPGAIGYADASKVDETLRIVAVNK